jgi:hypothetical protein
MKSPVLDKWDECQITVGRDTAPAIIDEFDRVLADARDANPLQTLLAARGWCERRQQEKPWREAP